MKRNYEVIPDIIKRLREAQSALNAAQSSAHDVLFEQRNAIAQQQRLSVMHEATDAGMTMAEIGEEFNISRQRVQQLLNTEGAVAADDVLIVTLKARINPDTNELESQLSMLPSWLPPEFVAAGFTFTPSSEESARTMSELHWTMVRSYQMLRAARVESQDDDDEPAPGT